MSAPDIEKTAAVAQGNYTDSLDFMRFQLTRIRHKDITKDDIKHALKILRLLFNRLWEFIHHPMLPTLPNAEWRQINVPLIKSDAINCLTYANDAANLCFKGNDEALEPAIIEIKKAMTRIEQMTFEFEMHYKASCWMMCP